jgi:hypothetical protein
MELSFKGTLEKLTWKQIRKEVAEVNPKFAKLIDELSPSDKYWVAKVTYPYGSMVMKRALLQLPNPSGDIVPITDSSIPTEIQEGLGYNLNSNPVSLVLKNKFEIFLPLEDRVISLNGLISPGTIFGAWRVLNPKKTEQPPFIWDMSSGARTALMLAKITEAKRHLQLQKAYHLTADVPRSLIDHWEIFRQLSKHSNFKQPWEAEILYFPQQWFSHLSDSKWKIFYYYLHDYVWEASETWRNQYIWNSIFSLILKDYGSRPNAYIMDTVKYLLYAGISAFPGLAPARDNSAGPFQEIQEIYIKEYGLKNYPPVIMQSEVFNMRDLSGHPVYYSLQFPNATEFKPNSRLRISSITDLYQIKLLMDCYERELISSKFNLGNSSFHELFRYVQYDYFHGGVTLLKGMLDSAEIAKEDKGLLTTIDGAVYKNFPDTCSFVRGCIRLSHKKTD